jgi:hypothetical protein
VTMQTTFAPGCLYKAVSRNCDLFFLIEKEGPLHHRSFAGGHSALVFALDSLLHYLPLSIWSFNNCFLKCLWNEQVVHLLVDTSLEFTPIDEAWGTEEEAKEDDP